MTGDLKALWDTLRAEHTNARDRHDPEFIKRLDVINAAIGALHTAFENERAHQPSVSQAPCPICGIGTVTYRYQAPLMGSMKCNTPDCFSYNL